MCGSLACIVVIIIIIVIIYWIIKSNQQQISPFIANINGIDLSTIGSNINGIDFSTLTNNSNQPLLLINNLLNTIDQQISQYKGQPMPLEVQNFINSSIDRINRESASINTQIQSAINNLSTQQINIIVQLLTPLNNKMKQLNDQLIPITGKRLNYFYIPQPSSPSYNPIYSPLLPYNPTPTAPVPYSPNDITQASVAVIIPIATINPNQ